MPPNILVLIAAVLLSFFPSVLIYAVKQFLFELMEFVEFGMKATLCNEELVHVMEPKIPKDGKIA